MKKSIIAAMMIFLTACSSESKTVNTETLQTSYITEQTQTESSITTETQTEQTTTSVPDTTEVLDTVAPPFEEEPAYNIPRYSLSDEKDIMEFLSEKQWYLTDRNTGEDYARLTVLPNGNITLERLDSGLMCDGTLTLKKQYTENTYDFFEIEMKNLSEDYMPADDRKWQVPETDHADFMFYIGTGGGEDYFTFREIGNGDSFTGTYVLPYNSTSAFDNIILHRDSEYTVSSEHVKDTELYAFCWKHDNGSIWLEPMTAIEKPAYTDYTDRKYNSASFVPNNELRIVKMQLYDRISEENFLYSEKWSSNYPMMMYKLYTDGNGKVTTMEEVDTAFYGLYDLGRLDADVSFSGTRFRYNHTEYDLSKDGCVCNDIMNIRQAGNRIVIEGHINPHKSEYLIFNTDKMEFEVPIYGVNLVWQQNDIRTCVYSDYNTVRDYKGNIIYTCDNEIYLLEITDEGAELEITPFDEKYNASEEKIKIPYPENYDMAMYAYSDFLYTNKPSYWYRFLYYAPKNSAMFVMNNPTEDIGFLMPRPERESFAGNTESVVAAVPLYDNATVRMAQGTYTNENGTYIWKNIQNGSDHKVEKGQLFAYYANIPEGIPEEFIYMYTDDFSVDYPIAEISGMHAQQSTFVQITAAG